VLLAYPIGTEGEGELAPAVAAPFASAAEKTNLQTFFLPLLPDAETKINGS
jgi:hypothetical protein